jgi:hypothetical protein
MEEKLQKTSKEYLKKRICYECINCCFITNNKHDYNRHLMTAKHKKLQKTPKNSKKLKKNSKKTQKKILILNV